MNGDAELRRKWGAVCLFVTPVALLAADIVSIPAIRSMYERHVYSGLVLNLIAVVLLFGANLTLLSFSRPAAPRLALAGSVVAAIGLAGGAAIMSLRLYDWALQRGLSPEVWQTVHHLPKEAIGPILPVILGPGLLAPVAMLLAGIGLWRFTNVPRWAAALVIAGSILFPAGRVTVTLSLILAADAVLLVAMLYLGAMLLRGARANVSGVPAPA